VHELREVSKCIRADFEARNEARDEALRRSRKLIRLCSTAIRSSHREEWSDAHELLPWCLFVLGPKDQGYSIVQLR